MLINLTNHPSSKWNILQMENAKKYGNILDLPFPSINPDWGKNEVAEMAQSYMHRIEEIAVKETVAVHIMGELSFTFYMVTLLKSKGITCLASSSERVVEDLGDGKKIVQFSFVRFREY